MVPVENNATCLSISARYGSKKVGAQNQSARPIEIQLETLLFALYCLSSTYSFNF